MKKLTYKQRSEIAHFNFLANNSKSVISTIKFWWKNREKLREVDELKESAEILRSNGQVWLSKEVFEQADRIWVDVYAPKE